MLALLGACQSAHVVRRPAWATQAPVADAQDEARARHLLRTAERAEAAGDKPGAAAMRASLVQRFPTTEAAAYLYEAKARTLAAAGAKTEAVDQLEHVLFLRPHYSRIESVRRDYAVLLTQIGRLDDAMNVFLGMPQPAAGQRDEARETLARVLVFPMARAGRVAEALRLYVLAQGTIAEADKEAWHTQALLWVDAVGDDEAQAMLQKSKNEPGWAPLRPVLALKLARSPTWAGDEAAQKRWLSLAIAEGGEGPHAQEAQRLMAQLTERGEVEPKTLGVLLPLTGRFQQFGERSRAAIELALAARSDLKIVIKDTQGDPNLAIAAVESLVYEDHAIAAMGPLFSAEAVAAATRAEALGLPLVSLSHQEGITRTGKFIFRTALTVKAQAQALAHVAMDSLHMSRFALLAPNNRYGTDFVQAFWDEVDARRGQIRGVEMYAPEATTFRQPIRKLVGRWYLNARPEFRDALKELKEKNLSAVRMRAEVERLDKRSRPIVDFDAIVIPDSGRQLGLLAPALAFEDLAVGRDAKALEKMRKTLNSNDIQPLTLLGASPFNSQQTLDACEQYCEGAVFVDAFFAGSPYAQVRDFVSGFAARTGAEPLLGEAQAFDTAALLARVLAPHNGPKNRNAAVAALHALHDFEGVAGPMHFTDDGECERQLQSLSIRGHRIEALATDAGPPSPSLAPLTH